MLLNLDDSSGLRFHPTDGERNLKISSPLHPSEDFDSPPGRVCVAMPFSGDNFWGSQKDLIDMNTPFPDIGLKRKRGFYPYTEDLDTECAVGQASLAVTTSVPRVFEDSMPWYRWHRKSFAAPEERVKSYKVPETPLKDDVFDAPPLKLESENDTISADDADELVPIDTSRCQQCSGHLDPAVLLEVKKFKSSRPLSGFEKGINESVEWIYEWCQWLNKEFMNKQSTSIVTKQLTTALEHLHVQKAEEPRNKRPRLDAQIAIIPPEAQWPPRPSSSLDDVLQVSQQSTIAAKPKKVKLTRPAKDYINRKHDDFIFKCQSRGICVCDVQRRTCQ